METESRNPAAPAPAAIVDERQRDRRTALFSGIVLVAITAIPYLVGSSLARSDPAGTVFLGLTNNFPDNCVYGAWMREASEGHLLHRNLFTTIPQEPHHFHLLFFLLGTLNALLDWAPGNVLFAARLILGVLFLRQLWWFLELVVADRSSRWAAYGCVCLSSGLGWLVLLLGFNPEASVDTWQPEALTFLSLYANPLMILALTLMISALGFLIRAERTGAYRDAVYAGLCACVLGNIHTYDICPLVLSWGIFLVVRDAARRRVDWTSWLRALIAGGIAAISTLHIVYLLRTDKLFAFRASVMTLSPSPLAYVLGYGFVLLLAIGGIVLAWRQRKTAATAPEYLRPELALFLAVWLVVNLATAYFPVSFQRRMIMGAHIPMAILAGYALCVAFRGLTARGRNIALAAALFVLSFSNLWYLGRDTLQLAHNQTESSYRASVFPGELSALAWIRDRAPKGASVQPLPWVFFVQARCLVDDSTLLPYTPAMTGHPVNVGHRGESPGYPETLGNWIRFLYPGSTDDFRIALLRKTGVRYLLYSQKRERPGPTGGLRPTVFDAPPPYLKLIPEASNPDADVYEVVVAP